MLRDGIKKKCNKKSRTKEMSIKIMETKFNIKIIWNQMLIDEIKNKIQLEKWLKQTNNNQRNEDQIWYKK